MRSSCSYYDYEIIQGTSILDREAKVEARLEELNRCSPGWFRKNNSVIVHPCGKVKRLEAT